MSRLILGAVVRVFFVALTLCPWFRCHEWHEE